jgi:hypothetical protein
MSEHKDWLIFTKINWSNPSQLANPIVGSITAKSITAPGKGGEYCMVFFNSK